jgi:Raf kinase inhibitor-like YbhB/YbcL family protein
MITNIPSKTTSIAEGAVPTGTIGKNEHGDPKYMGPCPPNGRHHYHFHVYALDTVLPATTKGAFATAIQGHVLAMGELVATYEKQKP